MSPQWHHVLFATFMATGAAPKRRHTPEPRDLAPCCGFIPTVEGHWKYFGNITTCRVFHTMERFTEMRLKKEIQKRLNYEMRIFFFTWNVYISNASCFLSLGALGGMGTRSHPDTQGATLVSNPTSKLCELEKSFNFSKLKRIFDPKLHETVVKTTQANTYECDTHSVSCVVWVFRLFACMLWILAGLQNTPFYINNFSMWPPRIPAFILTSFFSKRHLFMQFG